MKWKKEGSAWVSGPWRIYKALSRMGHEIWQLAKDGERFGPFSYLRDAKAEAERRDA